MNWLWAGLICIAFAALEAIAAGKDPAGALRSIRQPKWSPPFWLWAIIGVAWYVICLVSLARLVPLYAEAPWPTFLLVVLMAANGAWGIVQFRMKRFDLALLFGAPYAGLLIAFLWTVRPVDPLPFYLFAGYAAYLLYAAAWSWSIWRLNPHVGKA